MGRGTHRYDLNVVRTQNRRVVVRIVMTLASTILALQAVSAVAAPDAHGDAARMSMPHSSTPAQPSGTTAAPRAAAATAAPTATTPPLAVRGSDNAVWVYNGSGYTSIGGYVIAPPSVVSVPGAGAQPAYVLYFGTGSDHDVYVRDDTRPWQKIAPGIAYCDQAVAATLAATTLYIGCEGRDSVLWSTTAPVTPGTLPTAGGWVAEGGRLRAAPSAATVNGVPEFYVPGTDGFIWEHGAGGGPWSELRLQCYGHPVAAASVGAAAVTCRGLDSAMWYVTRGSGGWSAPALGGGILNEVIAARALDSAVAVDVVAPDSTIWENNVSPAGATQFTGLPGRALFTTELPFANDNIPLYRQLMPLDCETAALQMGLATYGHWYSQQSLFNLQSPDLRGAYWDSHGALHWGDPYTNFVGNVYGSEGNYTGYGVYFPPIVNIAHSHGDSNSTGGEALHSLDIYNEVAAGHPVVAWVEYHWVRPGLGLWTAWDGRTVNYSTWEHAVVLTGVSQTQVRVNDPGTGTAYWIDRSKFEASWHDFDNMAVVVK